MQQPIINAVNQTSGIVSANQGNLDSIAQGLRDQLPGLGQMAFGAQPGVSQGLGYLTDTLGGKYLGQGNPYVNDMVGLARENVANDVNSRFSLAGRTGGGANVNAMTKGMANAELGLRYNDYNQERQNMGQAAGLLPSMVNAQYAGIAPYLQTAQAAAEAPYVGVGALSPIIGLAQGSGTTTGTQKQGWGAGLGGLIGAGLSGWASGGFKGL